MLSEPEKQRLLQIQRDLLTGDPEFARVFEVIAPEQRAKPAAPARTPEPAPTSRMPTTPTGPQGQPHGRSWSGLTAAMLAVLGALFALAGAMGPAFVLITLSALFLTWWATPLPAESDTQRLR